MSHNFPCSPQEGNYHPVVQAKLYQVGSIYCQRVDHLPIQYLPTDFVYHCFVVGYSPTNETYEIPEFPVDDAIVKANPARSENVITSSNPAYGHFRILRQENDTKEDKGEDHTYELLPFDTPRQ